MSSIPQEQKAEFVAKMGRDFGERFYLINNEAVWLHAKWREYKYLYGTGPGTIEILNDSAGFFFKLVQDSLWDDILLHLSRLADPIKSAGKRNLSIASLIDLALDDDLKGRLVVCYEKFLLQAEAAREHRNKRLAHKDLSHSEDPEAYPIAGVSRDKIEQTLASLSDFLNEINVHYRDTTVLYDKFSTMRGANKLLGILRRNKSTND